MSSAMEPSKETLDQIGGYVTTRSHTTHWTAFLTIVLAALGTAMTFAIVCAG